VRLKLPAVASPVAKIVSALSQPRRGLLPVILIVGARGLQHVFVFGAFILVARQLGPAELGSFIVAQGFANVLAPFAERGAPHLLTSDLTRGVPPSEAYGWVVAALIRRLPVFLLILASVAAVIFAPALVLVFLLIGIVEMGMARLVDIVYAHNFAQKSGWKNGITDVILGVTRFAGALMLLAIDGGLVAWASIYLAQFTLVAVTAAWAALGRHALPSLSTPSTPQQKQRGMRFAVATCAKSSLPELERVMLAKLDSLASAGIYGAASRLVYLATMPFFVYQLMVYKDFFAAGAAGYPKARALARKQAALLAPIGAVLSVALFLLAPYAPWVLGSDYASAVDVVRGLAVIVALYAVYEPFGTALNGAGHERVRRNMHLIALAANLGLNAVLIPLFGLNGAIFTAIVSHALLFASFVFLPLYLRETRWRT